MFNEKYKISFNDVDSNLKVTNIAFMEYLVSAAGMHSEKVGYGLTNKEQTHLVFLLVGWRVKFIKRPKLFDDISINTWAESFSHSISTRNFEVYVEDELVAIASSRWILVNSQSHSMAPITKEIMDSFGSEDISVFDESFVKLKVPDKVDSSFEYTIARRDIDTNDHVNNLKYLELAFELIPYEDYKNNTFSEIIINYKNECKLSDKVICSYSKISDTECTIAIQSVDKTKTHSIITFKKWGVERLFKKTLIEEK